MDHLPVRLPRVVAGSTQMWLARAAPVGRGSGTTDRLLRSPGAAASPAIVSDSDQTGSESYICAILWRGSGTTDSRSGAAVGQGTPALPFNQRSTPPGSPAR